MSEHDTPWSPGARALKRGLDLAVSTVALLLLGPVLLLLAVLVRGTSPGPALFRQVRVGRGGRPFRILKFRTMVDGADRKGPQITVAGDSRVTPLGRFLRGTKLDELPQLINVWLGDMSLVGPRPEVPRYVDLYGPEDRVVLSVRPGVTDLASIEFRDEEAILARFEDRERAYVEEVMPKKLALARAYIERQSLLFDLTILYRTAAAVTRVG